LAENTRLTPSSELCKPRGERPGSVRTAHARISQNARGIWHRPL